MLLSAFCFFKKILELDFWMSHLQKDSAQFFSFRDELQTLTIPPFSSNEPVFVFK